MPEAEESKLEESVKDAAPESEPQPEQEETQETKSNGEDKSAAPEVPGVPKDKDGKRPSDSTIDFEKLKELLPEDVYNTIDNRFRSLYKQTKAQDRYLDQLGKDLDKKLSELSASDTKTSKSVEDIKAAVTQLSEKEFSAKRQMEIADIEAKMEQAWQDMDFKTAAKLNTQLQQKIAEPQPVETPKIAPEVQKQEPIETKIEDKQQDEFTSYQTAQLREWMHETDDHGNMVRPWALDGHPLNQMALKQTDALMSHPNLQNAPMDQILATVDQVMNSMLNPQQETKTETKKKEPPEVLTGDSDMRSKKSEDKISLTNEQKAVASRIFPKLSANEAEKKYLKSLSHLAKTGQL